MIEHLLNELKVKGSFKSALAPRKFLLETDKGFSTLRLFFMRQGDGVYFEYHQDFFKRIAAYADEFTGPRLQNVYTSFISGSGLVGAIQKNYLDGELLKDVNEGWVKQQKENYATQLRKQISLLHNTGYLYSDDYLSNAILTPKNTIALIDFGEVSPIPQYNADLCKHLDYSSVNYSVGLEPVPEYLFDEE